MKLTRYVIVSGAIVACIASIPSVSLACGACYGAPDSSLTAGMNMGIISLLVITGGVLGSFMTFFLHLRKRARLFMDQGTNNSAPIISARDMEVHAQ